MENSRSKTALDTKALFYFNYMHKFNVKHVVLSDAMENSSSNKPSQHGFHSLLPEQTIMSMIESTEGTEAFDEPQSVGGSLLRLDPKTIAGRLRKLSGGDWEIEKGGGGGRLFVVYPPTWVLSL